MTDSVWVCVFWWCVVTDDYVDDVSDKSEQTNKTAAAAALLSYFCFGFSVF